jgi:hypothetical protein
MNSFAPLPDWINRAYHAYAILGSQTTRMGQPNEYEEETYSMLSGPN